MPQKGNDSSLSDVLNSVVSVKIGEEKSDSHYFKVELFGVSDADGLMNENKIIDYMRQTLPVSYKSDFVYGSLIRQKMEYKGISIPEYNITLDFDGETIKIEKPYGCKIVSDRIKKISDNIKDIVFKEFIVGGKTVAILWYADTEFYGTITDPLTKGIRMRHGNILFGDGSTLRKLFKEERFNGWLVGELIIDSDLFIPNARRDDFEKNDEYLGLQVQVSEWSKKISKMIRKKSTERNLDEKQAKIVDVDITKPAEKEIEDIADNFTVYGEDEMPDVSESESVAMESAIDNLKYLFSKKPTKYGVINASTNLNDTQKLIYEKVFDLINRELNSTEANRILNLMVDELILPQKKSA